MGRISRRSRALTALAGLTLALQPLMPSPAQASKQQVSMLDPDVLGSNPEPTLQDLETLGVTTLRLVVHWANIAPAPRSRTHPAFDASDPAAYPAANWSSIDQILKTANADGLDVMITVAGHAPRWAQGRGEPRKLVSALGAWKLSVPDYGRFVHAVAERYDGHHGEPAVSAWEIYNEPNFGEDLSPQGPPPGSILVGADRYRRMVAAGWNALQATGHGRDTILIGALSAHGENRPDDIGETKPLRFIRELYCVDQHYHPFHGRDAAQRGCSTNARTFRAENPGLFAASGFSIHPYPLGKDALLPPDRTRQPDPDYGAFVQLPHLIRALDASMRAEGSVKRYPLWSTEYGYITDPPSAGALSWSKQAYYLNWAEYLSWKNPRIASFAQYLLLDPGPPSLFSSGLLSYRGSPKPAYAAWRLPLFMPVTSARRGQRLEVWGCLRPAPAAAQALHQSQTGYVQFRPQGQRTFTTVAAKTISSQDESCYFDFRIKFRSSGTVRLAYAGPAHPSGGAAGAGGYSDPLTPAVSRQINVTVR